MRKTSPVKVICIILLAAICAGVFWSIYYKTGPLYGELQQMDLIPMPERFTELYFADSSALPAQAVKGQPLTFAFTIHNEEGISTVYPYTVYFQSADGTQTVLAQDEVTLPDNGSTTINVSHTFTTASTTGMITVNLTSLNQQIDFLIPDTNHQQ